jgi:pyridoxal phosphate enzyme (YggS family)
MDTTFYSEVLERIHNANRQITIVAVTKTQPYAAVEHAYNAGIRHIGENRVEEAKEKILKAQENGMSDIVWHMIGHVQSRKIKEVVALFDRVDSVDSIELLTRLNAEARNIGKTLHILLELNIAHEEGKYGFNNFTIEDLQHVDTSHLIIDGCMTMAPFVDNAEDNRKIFKEMHTLSTLFHKETPIIGTACSMGTSIDWRVAIEEGATELRLGEALFGARK